MRGSCTAHRFAQLELRPYLVARDGRVEDAQHQQAHKVGAHLDHAAHCTARARRARSRARSRSRSTHRYVCMHAPKPGQQQQRMGWGSARASLRCANGGCQQAEKQRGVGVGGCIGAPASPLPPSVSQSVTERRLMCVAHACMHMHGALLPAPPGLPPRPRPHLAGCPAAAGRAARLLARPGGSTGSRGG